MSDAGGKNRLLACKNGRLAAMRMVMDDDYASSAGAVRTRSWSFGMWQNWSTALTPEKAPFRFVMDRGMPMHAVCMADALADGQVA